MLSAILWAFIAAASLIVGGVLALSLTLGKRTLGVIMAFGAGVLISAVAYELVFESVKLAKGTGYPSAGFFIGAFTFFFCDRVIDRMGAGGRKAIAPSQGASLAVPLVLAIILDGIPESVVIGLGLVGGGNVSVAMLVAVFISNVPEAVAGTAGMKAGGWSGGKILLLWTVIAVVCALASGVGYVALGDVAPHWLAFVQAFSGGAILMMLANTMIPEAYEHGGKLAGVFTVTGFAVSVWIIVLESAGQG